MSNQASEDELQIELECLYNCIWYDIADGADRKELWVKEIGFVVERLMRTEKLKLLAEVRERVIGEDEVFVDLPIVDGTGKTISIVDRSFTTYMVVKNHLRAEQRTKLTKMEAEL